MQKIASKYIKRQCFEEVAHHFDKEEITLITGSRQVGKTVLLEQLKDYLIKKKKISADFIFNYNLDLVQDWEIFQDQTDFIKFLKNRSEKNKIYVFVDEAQKVPEAARFFKGVFDAKLNLKLILTGSSSLEIKANLKETLAGRKRIFELPPFTFSEFLFCQDKILAQYLVNHKKISKIDQEKIINFYKDYLIFGGYPRVVLSDNEKDKINLLKEIYSSYIERDVIAFLEIKNKTSFNRLVKLLAAQTGQLVNIGELAANLAIDRETVERYIFALEQTFILKKLTPYFKNPRQEVIKANKIYFLDNGIRNLALENFKLFDQRIDKGLILENQVFQNLLLSQKDILGKIFFWRTKQKVEVDFVLEQAEQLLPIEVKTMFKKPKLPTGLRSFIDKFNPKKSLIANLSFGNQQLKLSQTKIQFIYPFDIERFVK